MKAVLQLNLITTSAEEGQRKLLKLCEKMVKEKIIDEYHFEITTPHGPVTEKCLLADQKVIA
ncbi:MAG: hypothetical protein ACPL5I_00885 [Thermodesulfobacteriota bacterium]